MLFRSPAGAPLDALAVTVTKLTGGGEHDVVDDLTIAPHADVAASGGQQQQCVATFSAMSDVSIVATPPPSGSQSSSTTGTGTKKHEMKGVEVGVKKLTGGGGGSSADTTAGKSQQLKLEEITFWMSLRIEFGSVEDPVPFDRIRILFRPPKNRIQIGRAHV